MDSMSIVQASTVLNSIYAQATGKTAPVATNTAEFVAQATTALKTGYDPVINAISQVITRTIFSIRPYSAKFGMLSKTQEQWGNHVRKLSAIDGALEDDQRLPLTDGQSVDPWKINKPKALQTNFYGEDTYQRSVTIFKNQLDTAFTGPEEFARFISMVLQNIYDQIEQVHENTARMTIANKIASSIHGNNTVELLTAYNTQTGLSLTKETVYRPDNFRPFAQWAFAFINDLASKMTERSLLYHTNITGKEVMRHTPLDRMQGYFMHKFLLEMQTMATANTFNSSLLTMPSRLESVNFWQGITDPQALNVTAAILDPTTGLHTTAEVESDSLIGYLMDEEAAGFTTVNEYALSTGMNARGGYSNTVWHFTERWWNDDTENGIAILME
jgi:hypothetical protein